MGARDSRGFVDDATLLTFSDLDYSVYHVILRNLSSLVDLRVADVARLAGVSNATVVRFCKKCGYAGFPALKQELLIRLREGAATSQLPPLIDDVRHLLADRTGLQRISDETAHAHEVLRWAERIVFMGSGRSGGLANFGAHLFSTLGVPSLPVTSFPTYATSLGQQDVATVVISHGGSTPMVLAAAQDMVGKGSALVTITARPSSPLAHVADACVCYGSDNRPSIEAAGLSTRLPALAVLEQLGRLLHNDTVAQGNN